MPLPQTTRGSHDSHTARRPPAPGAQSSKRWGRSEGPAGRASLLSPQGWGLAYRTALTLPDRPAGPHPIQDAPLPAPWPYPLPAITSAIPSLFHQHPISKPHVRPDPSSGNRSAASRKPPPQSRPPPRRERSRGHRRVGALCWAHTRAGPHGRRGRCSEPRGPSWQEGGHRAPTTHLGEAVLMGCNLETHGRESPAGWTCSHLSRSGGRSGDLKGPLQTKKRAEFQEGLAEDTCSRKPWTPVT